MSETKLCKVSYEELKEKQFTWNYKEYIDDDNFLHKDIENKKIDFTTGVYCNNTGVKPKFLEKCLLFDSRKSHFNKYLLNVY